MFSKQCNKTLNKIVKFYIGVRRLFHTLLNRNTLFVFEQLVLDIPFCDHIPL